MDKCFRPNSSAAKGADILSDCRIGADYAPIGSPWQLHFNRPSTVNGWWRTLFLRRRSIFRAE
ncbi:hypothetical protein HMPREF9371_0218 [Neisseria shayeganii 871]|uniref:Uncharacterized protein n=1 Tax=Neisseria shayeganii 871 TaxID=1032488 RepID=G4CF29_9NEIS|nr:hypothetical protein HMPREF9371_0218 [Neisseria shayeganii 871]